MKKVNDDLISIARRLEGLFEVLVLTVIFYFMWKYFYRWEGPHHFLGRGKFLLGLMYAVVSIIIFHYTECFKFGYLKLTDLIIAQFIGSFAINFITYLQLCLIANTMLNPLPMLALEGIDLVVAFLCCYIFTYYYHHVHQPRQLVLVYGDVRALSMKLKMEGRSDMYQIARVISENKGIEFIEKEIQHYDAVVISDVSSQMRNDLLKFCYDHKIRTYLVPKISDIMIRGAANVSLFDTPLLLVKGKGLTLLQRMGKRAMDLIICSIVFALAAPFMLIISICIKLEDRGPVFFKQDRVTKDGRVFQMIKFRSMIVDAEKYGAQPAVDKDPRITKIGRLIRATRLDELPQILNILKGDMSIVGPRPERVEHVEKYKAEIPEFAFREKVKGGLTGYAQIFGKYNTTAYDKLRLDLMYIENYSFLLDVKLLLLTVQVMLKKESTEGFDKNVTNEILLQIEKDFCEEYQKENKNNE